MGRKVIHKGETIFLDKVQRIRMCIEECKENGSKIDCRLYITTSKFISEQEMHDSNISILQEVKDILERNKEDYMIVDASFNSKRGFFEIGIQPCAVTKVGVYPLNWASEDIARLEELEQNGDIIILVSHL